MRYFHVLCFAFLICLSGCAAMQTAMEYSDLELISNTRRPVFLRSEDSRNLFLVVDCPVQEWAALPPALAMDFESKGYKIVDSRADADIIMAIQLRSGEIQKYSARAAQGGGDMTAGTTAIAGSGLGYLVSHGDPVSIVASAVGGLVVGGLADVTINSWAYLGILEVTGDILVLERTGNVAGEWWTSSQAGAFKETQTAVKVRAKQSGLKWEDAAAPVSNKLQEQLASVLPSLLRN